MFFTYVWVYLVLANVIMMYFSRKKKQQDIKENFEANSKKTVLYVVAHPDDESMFFVPVIKSMKEMGYKLHILCLSNGWIPLAYNLGNYDGLGKTREIEMKNASSLLGFDKVTTLDDKRFEDGPKNFWNPLDISSLIKEYVKEHKINGIVTFDFKGISGHSNHIACYHGVA